MIRGRALDRVSERGDWTKHYCGSAAVDWTADLTVDFGTSSTLGPRPRTRWHLGLITMMPRMSLRMMMMVRRRLCMPHPHRCRSQMRQVYLSPAEVLA